MVYFWFHGFNAAPMQDLQKAMGINAFSIYAPFGGKRSLYPAALKRYRGGMEREVIAPLRDGEEGLQAIVSFLQTLVTNLSAPGAGA